MRILAVALTCVAFGVGGAAQAPEKRPALDLQGKLYRSVFSSGVGLLTVQDAQRASEPLRSRLTTFVTRRAAFKSGYKNAPEDMKAMRSDAKKRLLEHSIVALIDTPGIQMMAVDFVAAAPIAHDWEGLPEGPLAEASFAENALKKDPASPLAPWFYIFIAQRQRVAFESYENQKNEEGMKATAKKYRAFVERGRAASDPIYTAIIDDMEAQPYLYIKTTNNPRDYDPDS